MTAPRLVRVQWEDASVADENGPWVHKEGLASPKAVLFDQVGWMLELTNEHVILTSATSDKLIAQRDRIPLGMVRRIEEFVLGRGKTVPLPRVKRSTA